MERETGLELATSSLERVGWTWCGWEMGSPKVGRLLRASLDDLSLDVSWIRVYVLPRARSQASSAADVIAGLARRGFRCESPFLSGMMRTLERKGYLARIATPDARRSNSQHV